MKLLYVASLVCALFLVSCERGQDKVAERKEEKVGVEKPMGPKALADSKGCFACHDINRKKVGPAFSEVARKYAGKEEAEKSIVSSIIKGSMGKWGSIPMPPQNVTEEEAKELALWILNLK